MDLVRDAATGDVLWQANASDRWDNISSFTEGDINVNYDYDPITGLVTDIEATRNNHSVFDQSFHWTTTGNLDYRNDAILDLEEIFGYDGYNRLTSVLTREFMGSQIFSSQSFDYAPNGNIIQKPGVVSFDYGTNASPYAVTGIQPEAGQESLYTYQEITYTSFDKLRTLAQDGKTLSINYDINRQRIKQSFSDGSTTRTKRYFTPLYESVTENGVTKKLHYLTAGTGLFAIFVTQNNGGGTMHYTLKDHQGNLTATICGSDVERLSYDAWGRRRNPVDFGYSNVTHTFDRGYTLHEHYDDFNLINMNGRLYDPIIGRMLSPDIAIQDEHDPQAYNRYSYCFNNPLRFTDPSGYVVRGSSSLFSGFTLLFYENHNRKGVLFNTDESLGLQLPKIEPFGEKEKEAYLAYRKEVFSYDTEEYRAIQAELIRLENAEEVFRIRIGGNATNAAGGGNFIYNKETGEFDVNIADFGDFKIIGKMAHELKHADQYMTGELAFDIRGDGQFGKPVAYDVYDEYDAYKRQSLFDKKTISNDVIRDRYKKLIQTRVSIDNVVFPNSKVQMIELNNYDYRTKNKKIRFIYHGWQNDIK